jgi:cation diffusion facilitator family transporter
MGIGQAVGFIPVAAALVGNALVTVIKAGAAFISGSSVMFSEAVHSFADTLNQLFLLIGVRRSYKKPDTDFGYGYGNERFFWALLSACGIFFIGAGITLYNGVSSLLHPEPIEIHALVFAVLAASFVIEVFTFWIAARGLKKAHPGSGGRERFSLADPSTLRCGRKHRRVPRHRRRFLGRARFNRSGIASCDDCRDSHNKKSLISSWTLNSGE